MKAKWDTYSPEQYVEKCIRNKAMAELQAKIVSNFETDFSQALVEKLKMTFPNEFARKEPKDD